MILWLLLVVWIAVALFGTGVMWGEASPLWMIPALFLLALTWPIAWPFLLGTVAFSKWRTVYVATTNATIKDGTYVKRVRFVGRYGLYLFRLPKES